jgi:hypothetical protein
MAALINYLIAGAALVFMIFRLKEKSRQDPNFNIGGLGIKSLINLCYLGIGCFIILILLVLLKL